MIFGSVQKISRLEIAKVSPDVDKINRPPSWWTKDFIHCIAFYVIFYCVTVGPGCLISTVASTES